MDLTYKKLAELIAFNRRNFIKLVLGGAVGIHISPLPWKLIDDMAIFTQNFPWLTVPAEGEFVHENSVCRLCPGGCGIQVRKVDERPVKIEGRTDYPVNPGGICPMGAGGLQLLYNENVRFTSPMKRVGPRGSGKFLSISWDEALTLLQARMAGLRLQGRPEAVAAVDGNPARSSMSLLIQRFMEALGSPNYTRMPGVEDTSAIMTRLMQGTEGPVAYDLENSDFVLSFGCGLIEGWGAPGRMIHAWGLWHEAPMKGKVKIVQVEARASNSASKADQWVAVAPGTEAALALGLAHVIIKERLYDRDFVNGQSFGFEDWISNGKNNLGFRQLVMEKYSPGNVATITGLDSNAITTLARSFAKAKTPIALWGKGKGDLNGSLFEFMAVHCLNALVGNINKPGGVVVHNPLPLSPLPEWEKDTIAREGLAKSRLDQAGSAAFPFSQSLIANMGEAIVSSEQSPVDTLLVFSANPAHNLPDGGTFRNALQKIPFIVSFSPYRDETAYMADLILPDHNDLEKMDDIVWPRGLQYPLYGLSKPVLDPLYDTRHSGDVIIQLAGIMGGSIESAFPWENYEEYLMVRAKGLYEAEGGLTGFDEAPPPWKDYGGRARVKSNYTSFNDMWDQIKSGGIWYHPNHRFGGWDGLFKTPTGKFEFFCTRIELAAKELAGGGPMDAALKKMGIHAEGDEAFMPHYEPAPSEEGEKNYPLLMMPYGIINLSTGPVPNPPYMNKTLLDHQLLKKDSFVEINPQTAAQYGLKEGDQVIVQSAKGQLKVRVDLFDGAMPGVVFFPMGFGHTAYDAFEQGKGVNPNEIIHGGTDPLSGETIWWTTRVKLLKA